ncbi:MAG: hypothetical protein ACYC9J_12210 [Sulfuricaulis sp.]
MRNYNNDNGFYDFRVHGERRQAERRRQPLDRRGILRWDPTMKNRRRGKDRRGFSALAPGR